MIFFITTREQTELRQRRLLEVLGPTSNSYVKNNVDPYVKNNVVKFYKTASECSLPISHHCISNPLFL